MLDPERTPALSISVRDACWGGRDRKSLDYPRKVRGPGLLSQDRGMERVEGGDSQCESPPLTPNLQEE